MTPHGDSLRCSTKSTEIIAGCRGATSHRAVNALLRLTPADSMVNWQVAAR